MNELKSGTMIDLTEGGQIKVVKELGRGGQGIVYLAEYQGSQYALKWYTQDYPDSFYLNIKHNIEVGAPSDEFLWPLMLTQKQFGSFGYVMKLRPQEYVEFGDYLLGKTQFTSFSAMLTAAMKISEGFYHLHLKGFSYQDLNDGNFFINMQTGDVLICDNDNVIAQGMNTGIMGKARYMAPEIVAGSKPDKYSDYYSLSVMLFMLFFGNHPLEGKKVVSVPCMTEKHEKKFYGSEALFIYDKNDQSNIPVRGVHTNVIGRWPLFPNELKEAFIDALSQDKLKNPTKRLIESKWESVFSNVRNNLVVCTSCGSETFADVNNPTKCINCSKDIVVATSLKTNRNGTIALSPKKSIFLGKEKQPIAVVRTNKKDPSIWALQNLTNKTWVVETKSGKIKQVEPKGIMPTKKGLRINFGSEKAEII